MTQSVAHPHLVSEDVERLIGGRHGDPFRVLGRHRVGTRDYLTVLLPDAVTLRVILDGNTHDLSRIEGPLFGGPLPVSQAPYKLFATFENGHVWVFEDPYRFGPVLGALDQHLIGEGTHRRLWEVLGAQTREVEGVQGTHFAVWAPNAQRVSLLGDFNNWDGRRNPMRSLGASGVWEIFMPSLGEGALYKFEIRTAEGALLEKADPLAFGAQHPPQTASVVRDLAGYGWDDDAWMGTRATRHRLDQPISIYEVHLGSWRRRYDEDGRSLSYRELAVELVDYVKDMGFTHVEFLPISEFPFDGSWGYQPLGLYAPTIRFGPPHEFRDLVEAAHKADLGVLIDWVPGHFPEDAHGLGLFDGSHLYEHADRREGFHQDWNTLIYNYGRNEVRNFLVANAQYWLEQYHIDGLRVDAVASMLYRDYSRNDGDWIPNHDGGRENYEAIGFLQEMNTVVYGNDAGIMTVAEESTSFPGVSSPVHTGGLGFGFKWNMGWMNDSLRYIEKDPIHRSHDHHLITFGIDYAFSENFILPISHDEVVHGKGSMLEKMPGNDWEKFANLRAYYGFMWGHPGKKLLFMGCEFAQRGEWKHDEQLDWDVLRHGPHAGMQALVRDLNWLYSSTPALHRRDCVRQGFAWLANMPESSVTAFARFGDTEDPPIVVICNFTPIERWIRVGLPADSSWHEVMNTDSAIYGGGGRQNINVQVDSQPWDGQDQSAEVRLPPLATIFLQGQIRERG